MGFRFYRRVQILPGLKVNLSRSGPSLTMGSHGIHYTLSRHGSRATVGLPGTGMSYTTYTPHHANSSHNPRQAHDAGRSAGAAAAQGNLRALAEHLDRYGDVVAADPHAQANLGVAAALGGDAEAAAFHLSAALPDLPPGDDRSAALAHLILAEIAQDQGAAASQLAERELASGSASTACVPTLLWAASVGAWSAGLQDQALAHLQELGRIDPYLPGLQDQKRRMLDGTFDAKGIARGLAGAGFA